MSNDIFKNIGSFKVLQTIEHRYCTPINDTSMIDRITVVRCIPVFLNR